MNILLDSNVLIDCIRKSMNPPKSSFISIITVGELKSFALRNKWGYLKQSNLEILLKHFPIIEVDGDLVNTYAIIDTFSQGLLLNDPLPSGMSARNMGKNDIWIAATALYFDMELYTKDDDFDHLTNIGLKLNKEFI
ncbi:MAG: type II toxin-antitoxin system VapC family toxin [Microscillaceae bacterium]|nr:type II toxin-antitoxin system VapC family toxin [Microscillaceae bacterium]